MTQLKRSSEAEADLDEILTYGVMRFGEQVGTEYFFSFVDAFDTLTRFPEAGRPADEVQSGLRRLLHRQHRIFYFHADDVVRIVRILHHAMDTNGKF